MQQLISDVFNAPLVTIFVLAGVLFLLIAVIGEFSGKIALGPKARVLSSVLGSAFITIGLTLYWWSLPAPTPFTPPSITPYKELTRKPPDKEKITPGPREEVPPSTGSATGELPDWVPLYPGANVENISAKLLESGGKNGGFSFRSKDYYGTVLNFYAANLENKKWEVNRKDFTLTATSASGDQFITVTSPGFVGDKYLVTFSESKM